MSKIKVSFNAPLLGKVIVTFDDVKEFKDLLSSGMLAGPQALQEKLRIDSLNASINAHLPTIEASTTTKRPIHKNVMSLSNVIRAVLLNSKVLQVATGIIVFESLKILGIPNIPRNRERIYAELTRMVKSKRIIRVRHGFYRAGPNVSG